MTFSPRPGGGAGGLRRRIGAVGALLAAFNLLAWAWALVAFRSHPLLMGPALLAYGFGLRHAVDADHIAAIDNVTRKLMQEGERPVAVGLYFSLGHSTVVVALSAVLAAATVALQQRFAGFRALGGLVGTGVSASFLFAIATLNLFTLAETWRSFRRVRRGERLPGPAADALSPAGGLATRLFRRLFRRVGRGWHMYALGLLFGLGFETASEIGLLGLSAAGAADGLSPWAIMVFPALFSAGMALLDTADGILMLGAYGWAFVKPVRKLYYNLTITFLSVLVAVVVGGIETLGLVSERLRLDGAFWRAVGRLDDNFGLLGYAIIGLFVLGWLVSLAIYKLRRYDEIEAAPRIAAPAPAASARGR